MNAPRSTVLIVDDTPDNIMLLSALLKEKYNTKVATNGNVALQILLAGGVDMVLLDVMMPDMDGYEVCRRIRHEPRTAEVPVIFLTAKSQPEDEAKGLAAGAVDYITKPISPPILFARVSTHLALRDARRELERRNAELEALLAQRSHGQVPEV
ncbi:putative two-component system response regulator [Pseudoduganella flava]|uniref:Response regulator n=1 Tax=Pseudoduganella flava TaxID=871742 RepID=A0A562PDD1_9BURK|nr:response regulator [Pseudoduganella flava]QGZ42196.1 response regulator [Pseudoduganella flava]TWI42419.1 putative two-component system response regulator [Pseudoduganella flava]